MISRIRRLALFGALAVCMVTGMPPADATLPGRNGQIAVSIEQGYCDPDIDQECGEAHFEIVGVHPRSGRRTSLDLCAGRRFCDDKAAEWSPDGRWLVFNRTTGDGNTLAISRPDGSGFRALPGGGGGGAWSPEGERLVFTRSADGALFVIGSDGSGSQQVTTRPAYRVDWSSRNRILFHRGRDIYSIRPSGRGLRRLTRTRASASARFASWSPDGRRIAFVLHPPAGFEEQPSPLIYIMRADGSLKRRLAPNGLFPTWAPDGKRIAFVRDDSLYAIRPDGTALRRVRHFRGLVRELAWQPRP